VIGPVVIGTTVPPTRLNFTVGVTPTTSFGAGLRIVSWALHEGRAGPPLDPPPPQPAATAVTTRAAAAHRTNLVMFRILSPAG
jgi:hypothetical protein